MSLFHCLGRTKISVQARWTCTHFVIKPVFKVRRCEHLAKPPSWRTTPCQMSAIAYAIHSKTSSILEAVPPFATWVHALPSWQGPTYSTNFTYELQTVFLLLVYRIKSCEHMLPFVYLCAITFKVLYTLKVL
jgi:hypothetical protein